jgi:hypothetical protein
MLNQPTQSFKRREKPVESTAAAQKTVNRTTVIWIVATLIGAPMGGASRRKKEMRDGLAGQVPEPGDAAVGCLN